MPEESTSPESVQQEILDELRRANKLTSELITVHRDWKLALRQGLLAGLGGAIGATVLVSMIVWLLKPLERLDFLKEPLDRIARSLERTPPK